MVLFSHLEAGQLLGLGHLVFDRSSEMTHICFLWFLTSLSFLQATSEYSHTLVANTSLTQIQDQIPKVKTESDS